MIVTRPSGVRHKDFVRTLRRSWPEFHRVKLDRNRIGGRMARWCRDYVETSGDTTILAYHSDGHEVWYFNDLTFATYFTLRWVTDAPASMEDMR